MGFRSWLGVGALLLLSACTEFGGGATPPVVAAPAGPVIPPGPPRVALLLPITGPKAGLADSMLKAAKLAMSVPGGPVLDVQDTAGIPAQAGAAAQRAIAAGDRMILGPLTAEETVAVAAVARPQNIPVLAFTSDPAAASPGVWTLGLTPGEQMRRLVAAARDDGRQHLAAILPQGALGDALQDGLSRAASDAGMDPPSVQRCDDNFSSFTDALKAVSNYQGRRGDLEQRIQSLREDTDPSARQQAAELAAKPVAPPPFDALLIGVVGNTLVQAAEELPAYDVSSPGVRVLGPALWAQFVPRLGKLSGAWYAALDPAARSEFAAAYQAHYGAPPTPFADYAFDAAAVARVLTSENDFSAAALTRAEGFTGVDGALALLPDGHVRRALAVYQITAGGGARIVSPAPQDVSQPGS
jgi:ABC-type branched-subunit amino acid transport system substrate-binding protein